MAISSGATTTQFSGIEEPNMSMASPEDGLMSVAGPTDGNMSVEPTTTTQAPAPVAPTTTTQPTTTTATTTTATPTTADTTADVGSIVKQGMTSSQIASAFKDAFGRSITQAELQEAIKLRAGLVGTPAEEEMEMPTVEEPAIDTTPTTTRVTEKPNPDGTITTETEQFTPEAERLQQQLQQHYDLAKAEMDYAVSQFDKIQMTGDLATKNLIESIQKAYQVRIDQMEQVNKAGLNAQKLLGMRSGRSRYAPELQSSILTNEERAGIRRLTQLEAEKLSLISEAQQAATDRDLKILNQRFTQLRTLRDEQTNTVKDMYSLARQEEERAQQKAKMEMEIQQAQRDFEQKQQENYMDALATNLVTLDGEGNLSSADFQTISEYAQEFGLDPVLLSSRVKLREDEMRKVSIDERKLQIDQQKMVLDQLRLNQDAHFDQLKYNLEVDKFGFSTMQPLVKELNGQYMQYDFTTGEWSGVTPEGMAVTQNDAVMSYARAVASGQRKFSDVPEGLKDAVIKAMETLPPDPQQIRTFEKKIEQLDSLLTEDGLKYAVGPNALARTGGRLITGGVIGYQLAKNEKNAFVSKVENLLSQEVLNKLIESKNNGATFGALSEGELAILQQSASTINDWAVDSDGDGRTDYYNIDEKTFKAEIQRIKDNYSETLQTVKAETPPQPLTETSVQTFDDAQWDLYYEIKNAPQFQGAELSDIIEAMNDKLGYGNERGSGQVFQTVVKEKYPTDSKGGQCGTWAHKIVKFPAVGDLKEQKFASVRNFGVTRNNWLSQGVRVGDVIITDESPKWGHVAIVNAILPGGRIQLSESNYDGDERVDHDRIISANSSRIYGAIRGEFNLA